MSPLEAAIERYRKRDWLPSDNATSSWPIYDSSRQSIQDAFVMAQAYIEQLDAKQQDQQPAETE